MKPLIESLGLVSVQLQFTNSALGWAHWNTLRGNAEELGRGLASDSICTTIINSKQHRLIQHHDHTKQAGGTPQSQGEPFKTARNWQALVNLEKRLKFPYVFVATTLRTRLTKNLKMLELNVP